MVQTSHQGDQKVIEHEKILKRFIWQLLTMLLNIRRKIWRQFLKSSVSRNKVSRKGQSDIIIQPICSQCILSMHTSRGVEKVCIGNEWVKKLKCLILTKCSSISCITSVQSIIIRFYQPVLFCTKFKSKFYHENIKRGIIQKVHHLQNGIFSGTLLHPHVTLCHFSPTPLSPVSFAKK